MISISMEDAVCNSDVIQRKIDDLTQEATDIMSEILGQIDKLDDIRESEVLRDKYINGMRYEEISLRMDYSYRQIIRFHDSGIKNLILS